MFRLEFRPFLSGVNTRNTNQKHILKTRLFLKHELHMEISTDPDKAVFSFNYNAGYYVCK